MQRPSHIYYYRLFKTISMDEAAFVRFSAWTMIALAILVFVATLGFISAPYGRYGATSTSSLLSGFKLPAKLSWFIMESPTLWACFSFYYFGLITCQKHVPIILYSFFIIHYTHRAVIFPYRMKAGAPMPLFVMMSALFYCSWNGLMQAVYFLRVATYRFA